MEKQNQLCQRITEKKANKTAVVSLMTGAMEIVLRAARNNQIAYVLIGTDQNGREIIKFEYRREQQNVINSICDYILFFENLLAALKSLAEPAIKIINDELLFAYLKLKEERDQENMQNKNYVETIDKITDGNERGE